MNKITFIINDENSLNEYGMRIMNSALDFSDFLKNPVMLYNHLRTLNSYNADNIFLPIGKWENLRTEGYLLLADAIFDDDNALGTAVSGKVERGFLHACSVSVFPIEWSEDATLMLQGQTSVTITKSRLQEISICDIPGAPAAVKYELTATVDDRKPIQLTGTTVKLTAPTVTPAKENHNQKLNMEKFLLKLAAELGLTSNATEQQVEDAIKKMKAEHADFTLKLTSMNDERANALVEGAVNDKKILADEKDNFLKLAKSDFKTTAEIIGKLKSYNPVNVQLASGAIGEDHKDWSFEDWQKRDPDGLLQLRSNNKPAYDILFSGLKKKISHRI